MLDHSRISLCVSPHTGGGLFIDSKVSVSLTDSTIEDCVAGGVVYGGGGVSMGPAAKLVVIRSELSRNMAPSGAGGGLAAHGGRVWLMAGSRLIGNSAIVGGGFAYNTDLDEAWPSGAGGEKGRLFASSSAEESLGINFAILYSKSIVFISMGSLQLKYDENRSHGH